MVTDWVTTYCASSFGGNKSFCQGISLGPSHSSTNHTSRSISLVQGARLEGTRSAAGDLLSRRSYYERRENAIPVPDEDLRFGSQAS
jgi:hypothetical protein